MGRVLAKSLCVARGIEVTSRLIHKFRATTRGAKVKALPCVLGVMG